MAGVFSPADLLKFLNWLSKNFRVVGCGLRLWFERISKYWI